MSVLGVHRGLALGIAATTIFPVAMLLRYLPGAAAEAQRRGHALACVEHLTCRASSDHSLLENGPC